MRLLWFLLLLAGGCNQILGVHTFERSDGGAGPVDTDLGDGPPDAAVAVQQAYIKATNSRSGAG